MEEHTLYQIENLKSGRKVNHTSKGYKWGCDCGKDGSYFTWEEVLKVERALNIDVNIQGLSGSDCGLVEYDVSLRFGKPLKKIKSKKYKDSSEYSEDPDDLI